MEPVTISPRRSRVRRVIQNPATAIFLTWILLMCLSHRVATYTRFAPFYVLRTTAPGAPTTYRLIDEEAQSWGELAGLTQTRPDDLVQVATYGWHRDFVGHTSGPFFHTTRHLRPHLLWLGEPFSPRERDDVRSFLADFAEARGRPEQAALLRGKRSTEPIWTGYALNIAVLIHAAMTFWSWGWVLRVPADIRDSRLRRGLCYRCKYDLRNVPVAAEGVSTCPECGAKAILPTEARAPARASEGSG